MLVRWLALLRVPRYTKFPRRLEKKSIRDSLLKGLGFQPHRKYRKINSGSSRRGEIRSSRRVFQPPVDRSWGLGVRPVVRQMKGEPRSRPSTTINCSSRGHRIIKWFKASRQ